MDRGGACPPVCENLYTTKKLAEAALIEYIKSTDRNGYAKYPGKESNVKSQD